jgi:hypothetical protein
VWLHHDRSPPQRAMSQHGRWRRHARLSGQGRVRIGDASFDVGKDLSLVETTKVYGNCTIKITLSLVALPRLLQAHAVLPPIIICGRDAVPHHPSLPN